MVAVLAFSGPHGGVEELSYSLELARQKVQMNVFHSVVPLICQVFPAYKPEELYQLDYETFMLRLAQAEDRLLNTNILAEPIQFLTPEETPSKQRRPNAKVEQLLNLREQHKQQKEGSKKMTVSKPQVSEEELYFPPVPEKDSVEEQTVITTMDMQEHTMHYMGHEVDDRIILEYEMSENTSPVYKEYQEQIAKGEKVVFRSPEERAAEFREVVRKRNLEREKHQRAQAKEDLELAKLIAARKKQRGD